MNKTFSDYMPLIRSSACSSFISREKTITI